EEPARKLVGDRLAKHDRRDSREGVGVAREPAGRVGGRRLRHHARDIDAAMRRADAVKPAKARRHAYRAAGGGAERGVAEGAGAPRDAKPLARDERADIVTARASVVCHLRPPLNTSWPGLSRPSTWIPGTSPGMTIVVGRMQHAFLAAEQFAERLGGDRVRHDH